MSPLKVSSPSRLPRISLVTPSFNQGAFIGRTIDSVLGQEYPNLDYFVVDGGSTDGTLEILRGYGSRIRWISEPDRGQSHALNKGLAAADGDVLAFLNSDDVLLPGVLRRVGEYFRDQPGTHWLTGRCRTIDARDREIRRVVTAYKNAWLYTGSIRVLQCLNYVSQPATFWSRELYERVGPFNEDLRYAMDYDYWLRAAQHYRLHVLHRDLACFRIHGESKAGAVPRMQFDADLQIARTHVRSRTLLAIHALHNRLIIAANRVLLAGIERDSLQPAQPLEFSAGSTTSAPPVPSPLEPSEPSEPSEPLQRSPPA